MSSMTNQEAIEILTEMRDWNDYITQSDALQMAIDELEKKPAANSEDAISRQAVLDAMATWDWQELYLPIHFKQLLENLPSVSCSEKPNRCGDAISRQAAMDGLGKYHDGADLHIDGLTYAYDLVCKLPTVSTEISELLHKAKSEIRCGENKAYNADFTMGCEYAISVIERMFEEVGE